ncbi:hypothetical protein BGZ75_001406 [Mortierella antarctica]|nr:hypothetical protein BGZ75_001406 [Mortierella antarctica]
MGETQSFRIAGSTAHIENIDIDTINGQDVIFWEDIKQVFPGIQHLRNGSSVVKLLRDSDQNRITPHCIKHHPKVVLDVVVSSAAVDHVTVDPTLATSSLVSVNAPTADPLVSPLADESLVITESTVVEALQVASAPAEAVTIDNLASTVPTTLQAASKTALSFRQVVQLVSKKTQVSDSQIHLQKLDAKMDRMIKLQEDFDAKQEEFNQLQSHSMAQQQEMKLLQKEALERQEEMKQLAFDHHEEIRQLQIQALGQLAVLQDRIKAVLTQTYELHEYPIPRLFVVLPQDLSKWRTRDPFSNKFRLYFLCECGEHTESIDSNMEIHFAMHEGYEIARPTEFFQLYGSHVLAILKMLKFGISVAGVAVPAISHLVRADAIDQATNCLKVLRDIEPLMDPVIDWMDKVSTDEGEVVDEFAQQMKNKEALEGADLRKLATFLTAKDGDKVLSNLYRTVTDEGHVKWVCIDHYRENYQASTAKDFQRILNIVGGSFDRSIGRVEVRLQSKALADQFSLALGKARSVYELDVNFDWACTTGDLEVLESALKKSRIAILTLGILRFRSSNLPLTSSQQDVLFRVKGLPNMKILMLHVVLSKDVIKLLSAKPKTSSCHCKLSIAVVLGSAQGKEKITDLAEVLKTNSTLSTLTLQNNSIGDDGAKALGEALKTNSTLTTLDLNNNSIGDDGAKMLGEALKTNSTLVTLDLRGNLIWWEGFLEFLELLKTNSTLTMLDLTENKIAGNVANALAESCKTNSTLATLDLRYSSIGYDGAKALSEALKTNSTLTTLGLLYNSIGDDGAKALGEALRTNSTLTTLYLSNNSIGDHGAKALGEALKTNSTLTTLDLRSNAIGDVGAKALGEALKTNSTLMTLDFANNSIGDDGAKALGEALKTNSALTTLDLRYNSIGDDGAKALGEALKTNSALTTLDLRYNSIGDDGAKALGEALKTSSNLAIIY